MVAPMTLQELLVVSRTDNMAAERAAAVEERRRQLLAANKEAARLLLVSISLGSAEVLYTTSGEDR